MPTTSHVRALILASSLALTAATALVAPSAPAAITPPWQSLVATGHQADDTFVGVDVDGRATAVWTERGRIFTATRPDGGHFGFGHAIRDVTGADLVAFAEAPDGAAVIAWTDLDRHRVRAALRRAGAVGFGAPVPVSGSSASNVDYFLDAAIGADGTVAISWRRETSTSVKVQAAVNRGSGFHVSTLDTSTDPTLHVENPDVGVDGSGRVIVVWDHRPQFGDDLLKAAISTGSGFGASQVAAQVVQGPTDPTVGVAPGGRVVLAYQDFTSAPLAVRSGDLATGTFGSQQTLLDEAAVSSYEAAVDDSGRGAVLASYAAGGSYRVGASVSTADGTFPMVTTLSTADQVTGPGISEDELAVTPMTSGEFGAFWENDGDGTEAANQAWSATTTSSAFGTPTRLSRAGADVAEVHGAANSSGDVVTAWVLDRPGTADPAQVRPAAADTVLPRLSQVSAAPANLRRGQVWRLSFRPSEEVQGTITIRRSNGTVVATLARNKLFAGQTIGRASWNGRAGGKRVSAGTYRWVLQAVDVGGHHVSARGQVVVRP